MANLAQNLPLIGFSLAVAISLAALGFLFHLRARFSRLFTEKVPETVPEALSGLLQRTAALERGMANIDERLHFAEGLANQSFQKIGFMRFNPFENTGGDQSFSIALLDYENNGFVILSLYGREGTRVYAKAIDHGVSKHPLSHEEEEVLHRAMSK